MCPPSDKHSVISGSAVIMDYSHHQVASITSKQEISTEDLQLIENLENLSKQILTPVVEFHHENSD